MRLVALIVSLMLAVAPAANAGVLVAVAANFEATARRLAAAFAEAGGGDVQFAVAATGKLYAQALNGAPFDLFLAADLDKPARLAEARGGQMVVYARGRLALAGRAGVEDPRAALTTGQFARLALADPRTAPYGAAAKAVLAELGVAVPPDRLALATNAQQAVLFVVSGAADLGFLPLGSARAAGLELWEVPGRLHPPIDQGAVLLSDDPQAQAFLDFILSPAAQPIIAADGYQPAGAR